MESYEAPLRTELLAVLCILVSNKPCFIIETVMKIKDASYADLRQ